MKLQAVSENGSNVDDDKLVNQTLTGRRRDEERQTAYDDDYTERETRRDRNQYLKQPVKEEVGIDKHVDRTSSGPRRQEAPLISSSAAAMPSIAVSDSPPSNSPDEVKKSKHKKSKNSDPPPPEPESPVNPAAAAAADQSKTEKKKKKKHKKVDSDDGEIEIVVQTDGDEKKKKKRKKASSDEDAVSDEPAIVPDHKTANGHNHSSKKRKMVEKEDDGDVTDSVVADPNAVSNFRISKVLMEKLKSKGIEALFPIQAMTFNDILEGADLVGRARTGQGKTLAFVLPILESLTNGQSKVPRKTGHGRSPSVLVLLPTRELAKQVHVDFEVYGGAVGVTSCCLYGGSPYRPQENALSRGVDIVIGTPGRIKDHLERGNLDLKTLKFRVLDEADEMLNMGFKDDVELILGKVQDVNKVQTLLFSATLPEWVKKISARFLKPEKKTADLVGNEKLKASASVRHLVLPCSRPARPQIIPDIIRCYSRGGRTIIFAETKENVSELAGLLPGARALHGDIMQAQREVVLAGFRSGRFLVLVATNVAARGLDINDVQLIIQCEPPKDVEAYIHRSGRTGRAGNTGISVLLYEPRYSHSISRIERESGVKFEHISAPQPADVAESAGSEAAVAISDVSDSVVPVFRSQAEQLLSSSGMSAVDLLAKALAKAAGYTTDIKKRSLLSSMENYVTLLLQAGKPIFSPSLAFCILRRFLPDEKIAGVKGVSVTADGMGAVFDVPTDDVKLFLEGQENADMVSIEVLAKLPPLQDKDQGRGNNSGRGRFGGGGGNRFSGSGRSGGFSSRGGRGRGGSSGGNRFNRRN